MNRVSIIILNWNAWEHTLRCLATVFHSTCPDFDVILVDNGSTEDSLSKIREWAEGKREAGTQIFPENPTAKPTKISEFFSTDFDSLTGLEERAARSLTIIKIRDNVGFTGGCNLGIRYALKDEKAQYILTLNNDMEIDADCVTRLLKEAQAHPTIGACQAKVLLSESPGYIDGVGVKVTWFGHAALVGHGEADRGQYAVPAEIFGAYPATALFRRKMLEDIGLFDEDFFVYYEDVDLCLRARKAGWRTRLVPSATTYHFHSAAYGKASPQKIYYLFRNLLAYTVKSLSIPSLVISLFFYYPLVIFVYIMRSRGDRATIKAIFQGAWDGFLRIPHFLKKRQKGMRRSPPEMIQGAA